MTIGIVTMSHDAPHRERFIRMVTKSYTSYPESFGSRANLNPTLRLKWVPGTLASYEEASGTSSTCWR